MEIQINIAQDDWLKFQKLTMSNIRKNIKYFKNILKYLALFFLIVFLCAFTVGLFRIEIGFNTNILYFFVFIIIFTTIHYNNNKLVAACAPSRDGPLTGQHTLRFDSSGIHENNKLYEGHYSWAAVKEIVHTSGLILIYIDTCFAILIPDDQVGDVATFIKTIEAYRNNSPS